MVRTHQNATTATLLKTPATPDLSRCDNAVTHARCHATVTRDPRPVPGSYSPLVSNSPTSVVKDFGHQKSRSLATVMGQLAASERRNSDKETTQL